MHALADTLFEVSWEVCNKVGGIYTVVKSKAALTRSYYKNYYLIGPYVEQNAIVDLQQLDPSPALSKVFNKLRKEGINCHYGKWLIKGEPDVILIDFQSLLNKENIDKFKTEMWEEYKVESLFAGYDFEEPMIFSYAVARLIAELKDLYPKAVSHFHEWMTGITLLFLKKQGVDIGTVFTTHATMVGRSIAGSGRNLYELLDKINPAEEAKNAKVLEKFTTERACAQKSDVFTTVSEITGIEAEKILGRKPDVLLLNGLDIEKFPSFEETSVKHVVTREIIREFLTYHFFPYYSFDIRHCHNWFIVGRHEYRNKGVDILIKALGELNRVMKREKPNRTIAVFFWIPNVTHGIKVELLENKTFYRNIKGFVQDHLEEIENNIVSDIVSQRELTPENIFTKDFLRENKRNFLSFKRSGNPPVLTHNIPNEKYDPILTALHKEGLDNKEDDYVKVIYYPVYLSGADGLLDLNYYDAIAGSHLGIFPSYYEPWGYTPLESAALGVPAITTDLAGFGRFMDTRVDHSDNDGVFVLQRYNKKEHEIVKDFASTMYKFAMRHSKDREQNKINAKQLSKLCDWKNLVTNYVVAQNLAMKRCQDEKVTEKKSDEDA